jgi:hypothetical protein
MWPYDMSITTSLPRASAHEKTIDVRLARLREATVTAARVHRNPAASRHTARRALVVLIENRTLVAAHAGTLTEQIITTHAPDEQDDLLLALVRPITIAVEEANTAIARLRHTLGEHG